ncbi:MAG: PEP-CTERM sorting domain-containing protein [Gemmataceae bacterium]
MQLNVQAVPEPTSLALLGLSLGAMGTYARRRLKKTPVETEAAV